MPEPRPLKSLHLDTERTWRGGEQQALYLAAGLVRRGHGAVGAGIKGGEFARRFREAGLVAHEGPLRGELDPRSIAFVSKLLREESFDIVHAHTSHAHTIGAIAAATAGVPCVVSRRVDFPIRQGFLGLNHAKYRYGVARFLAISSAVRTELLAAGVAAERIVMVPSGIDIARHANADRTVLRREFGIADDAPVVGAVGHFAWHKGFETLIDAAPRLLARRPAMRFVLVGDGELREALVARTVAAGAAVRDAFVFPGFRPDVASFLARFDVVAAPSLLEGLNTSILDALGLGRPVVASRIGGIPDAIADGITGLLVPRGDPEALAAGIERVLDDPALAKRLGDAGRDAVHARFTADAMVEGTLRVYRDVLADRAK